MQGIDAPRVTVESDSGSPHSADRSVQRAAQHASRVARALESAGYEPRHLSVTFSETGDLVLVARLDRIQRSSRAYTVARLAVGIFLGLLLGFLGLPRLELPFARAPEAAPTPIPAPPVAAVVAPQPTPVPPPTPTTVPPAVPVVLNLGPFNTPISGWPNDPNGTAWFASGTYHLYARQPGSFVAVGIPIAQPVHDAQLRAQFHKTGGPPGGGYGLIIRDQGATADRDGRGQTGNYLVVEVGDRGDVGVWQRDQTRWIDVVPWTHSDAVHTDLQPNMLLVALRGASLQFQVNGQIVADLSYDRVPPSGGVGLFTGGDLNEVALDWLRIDPIH